MAFYIFHLFTLISSSAYESDRRVCFLVGTALQPSQQGHCSLALWFFVFVFQDDGWHALTAGIECSLGLESFQEC